MAEQDRTRNPSNCNDPLLDLWAQWRESEHALERVLRAFADAEEKFKPHDPEWQAADVARNRAHDHQCRIEAAIGLTEPTSLLGAIVKLRVLVHNLSMGGCHTSDFAMAVPALTFLEHAAGIEPDAAVIGDALEERYDFARSVAGVREHWRGLTAA